MILLHRVSYLTLYSSNILTLFVDVYDCTRYPSLAEWASRKPVLCNACGSRWRTKGTLINYTPLHSRAEPDDFMEYKVPKVKLISIKNKDTKFLKIKQSHEHAIAVRESPDYNLSFRRSLEEDTSNRSSSGSAISYSESCAQYGGADASELTGSAQSVVWDTLVPSKKRTCVGRPKPSSVEKLTKDLHSILHEQQSSYFSGSSEEDLIFDGEAPMVSVEIGHGSILMKHPNSVAREEESEASSFTTDSKSNVVNEVHSGSTSLPVYVDTKNTKLPSLPLDEIRKSVGPGSREEQTKGNKSYEMLQVLQNRNSPLTSIDLKDVVRFEEFVNLFTHEEKLQLMKHLPSVDTMRHPDSLESMFDSLLFAENLSSFQQLLAEGIFDISSSEVHVNELKTLKKLALMSLTKSKWVEQYSLLKDVKRKQHTVGKAIAIGSNVFGVRPLLKRHRDSPKQQEPQAMMRSPKKVIKRASFDTKDNDYEGSCFSPGSLFVFPPDKRSLMLDYLQFNDDSSDQDLLLDVPSNGSFPQAELLYPTSSFGSQQASTSSSTEYPHLVRP
ncbi:hypothetical protein IFM89_022838 [Coptis chinensis]|uniref:DEUBAD domain-containing protein n=1 Tax=Coptis chinensis TaxID=261450 RepID=A0A835IWM1_9MAGN|nr:hypothetical protein IFM89_022838 [Coptis chinensis]